MIKNATVSRDRAPTALGRGRAPWPPTWGPPDQEHLWGGASPAELRSEGVFATFFETYCGYAQGNIQLLRHPDCHQAGGMEEMDTNASGMCQNLFLTKSAQT
jgi:hypothetical protein